jgi:hypothetical protein
MNTYIETIIQVNSYYPFNLSTTIHLFIYYISSSQIKSSSSSSSTTSSTLFSTEKAAPGGGRDGATGRGPSSRLTLLLARAWDSADTVVVGRGGKEGRTDTTALLELLLLLLVTLLLLLLVLFFLALSAASWLLRAAGIRSFETAVVVFAHFTGVLLGLQLPLPLLLLLLLLLLPPVAAIFPPARGGLLGFAGGVAPFGLVSGAPGLYEGFSTGT